MGKRGNMHTALYNLVSDLMFTFCSALSGLVIKEINQNSAFTHISEFTSWPISDPSDRDLKI